jgi:glucose/arabinose dehydrogenase
MRVLPIHRVGFIQRNIKTLGRTGLSLATAFLIAGVVLITHTSASPNGLVASYNFDEGSGATLNDRSGTGNNGTLTNGPAWNTSGKYGKALSFDGTNDYVNIPDSNSLDLTNGMTLEAWVKPTAATGYKNVIFKQQPGHEVYAMYVTNGANKPTGHVNIGGEKTAQGTAQVSTTAWTHLTTTYDGTALKLFVNGVQVSSTAVTGNIPVSSLPLNLGGDTVWPEWFKGLIDDVRIYNRALSPTEIQTDMNTPVAPPVTDTTRPSTPTGLAKIGSTENSISVSWNASTDNVGVVGYGVYKNFFLDSSTPSTSATLNGLACGTAYNISIDAVDAAGNRSVQTTINAATTACDTTPPSIPANLVKTASTSTSISLSWNASTDNVSVASYDYFVNGAMVGNTTGTANIFRNLTCGTSYSLGVEAIDASGNHSARAILTASTVDCDVTLPTVQITNPANGTTVNGAVAVNATASDNVGIAGVQFKLDSVNLGSEDATAPYSVTWDTTTATSGNHTLTAVARDTSGNLTTSSPVTVTVPTSQTPNFVDDNLIVGLSEPTNIVFAPDGRMFIIERGGKIWVTQPNALAVDPTPVLSLTNVWTADERGLLGLELDPNFMTNGYIYVYFTNANTSKNEVSRYTVTNNVADINSKVMLWQNDTNAAIWHQGGDLHFGPDGKLYISVGDHLSAQTSQDVTSFNGKILRINSDGTVPTDNPFYDGAGPNKDAIWVMGLRNPFRFSIDSVTNKMFIGDVGEGSWEEVNVGLKGANYGWPTCEGNCSTPGMTNPIYTYDHGGGLGGCVVGGFVYRGNQFPASYQGSYFFADYAKQWIKRINFNANGDFQSVQNFLPLSTPSDVGTSEYGNIVALKMGPDGSLYYVNNGPFATPNAGSIKRIKNTNANQPPTAQISANVTSGPPPLTVNFSSAGSIDPEGQPITYSWDFGDGSTSTSANPTHVYGSRGRYTARLITSDGTNTTPSSTLTITVGNPPTANIVSPVDGTKYRAGDTISFSGDGSDPDDGVLPSSSLSWKVVFHHNSHIHPVIDQITGSSGSFQIPFTGHGYNETVWYEIILTATDSDGIQTQKSANIYPDKTHLSFTSQPAGVSVVVDGIPQTTPFEFDTLIGMHIDVSVDSPQFISGSRYDYANWSDGGAQAHTITAPATPQSYNANFNLVTSAPQGLVAAYNFNEGIGPTVYDQSGNNNNGTINGPIWTASGKYGNALQFDGVNDLVSVPDANSLDLTNGMTLESWISPDVSGGFGAIMFKQQPGHEAYAMYVSNGANKPTGHVNIGGEKTAQGPAQLPVNTWTHLAVTYDGSALKLFVNGVQVSSTPVTGNIPITSLPLTIGGDTVWPEWFKGIIDDVRIYNRALTPTEIQNDMNIPA